MEPAKHEVRKNAMSIISNVSKLNRTPEKDRQDIIGSISEAVFATISIIETLMHVGLVSPHNGSIVKRELIFLVRLADGHVYTSENQSSLDQTIFDVPAVRERVGVKKTADEKEKRQSDQDLFLTQIKEQGLGTTGVQSVGEKRYDQGAFGKETSKVNLKGHIGHLSDNRISSIIGLLKTKSHLSVRDFTEVIPGVSEKTIQRELAILLNKGIISRVGERRWTRYSLAE